MIDEDSGFDRESVGVNFKIDCPFLINMNHSCNKGKPRYIELTDWMKSIDKRLSDLESPESLANSLLKHNLGYKLASIISKKPDYPPEWQEVVEEYSPGNK